MDSGHKTRFKIRLIVIIIIPVTFYVFFGAFLFFSQKSMIYFPDNRDFGDCPAFGDYQKISHNGTRFYFRPGKEEKAMVFYNGNAGSACDRSQYKFFFEPTGASMLFVEYAGYANDQKKPSQKLILKDVKNIQSFLNHKRYKSLTVYGESLGAGAACYHASIGQVDNLILLSPFSSLTDVVKDKFPIYPITFLLTEKYDNTAWLKNYRAGLIIFHGRNDTIIPPKFSQKLFTAASSENKEYVLLEGVGHNDIWLAPELEQKLIDYLSEI